MEELPKYQMQFERVKRWYARLVEINEGKPHDLTSDNYEDDFYAFFMNCFHLKDWIKNDDDVSKGAKKEVEKFVEKTDCLATCGDICNSLKHLKHSNRPHSDQNPQFGAKKFQLVFGRAEPIIRIKFSVETKSGTMDAFVLASQCVQKWDEFVKTRIIA